MQLNATRLTGRAYAVAALAFLTLLLWPPQSRAQSTQASRDQRRAEMESRQRALHTLGEISRRPRPRSPDTRPAYSQVAEDFEQLQVKSHLLSAAAELSAGPQYRQIREHAADVRKRASRLRQTLALPEADDIAPKQKKAVEAFTPERLAAAVASLEAAIQSFVWNPAFQQPDVIVPENSLKARRDLEEILWLSERIGKAAEALGKGQSAGKDD